MLKAMAMRWSPRQAMCAGWGCAGWISIQSRPTWTGTPEHRCSTRIPSHENPHSDPDAIAINPPIYTLFSLPLQPIGGKSSLFGLGIILQLQKPAFLECRLNWVLYTHDPRLLQPIIMSARSKPLAYSLLPPFFTYLSKSTNSRSASRSFSSCVIGSSSTLSSFSNNCPVTGFTRPASGSRLSWLARALLPSLSLVLYASRAFSGMGTLCWNRNPAAKPYPTFWTNSSHRCRSDQKERGYRFPYLWRGRIRR